MEPELPTIDFFMEVTKDDTNLMSNTKTQLYILVDAVVLVD